jgi:hypothetical protein
MPICLLQLKVQMKGLSFQYYCCSTSWWNWFVMQITWVVWWQWLSSLLILAVSTAKIYCGIGAHKIEMIFWNFCNTEIIFFLMFCTILAVAAWSMVESAPLLQPTALPLPPCRSHRRGQGRQPMMIHSQLPRSALRPMLFLSCHGYNFSVSQGYSHKPSLDLGLAGPPLHALICLGLWQSGHGGGSWW